MRIEVVRPSTAPPAALWEIVEDLAAWPQWCPAFAAVQPDGPPVAGTTVRVVQPGVRAVSWTIDEVVPGHLMRWISRGPGFAMVAERRLDPDGSGTSVRLSLAVTGIMAWAVSLIARRPMRRYLDLEAGCLAGRVEQPG